MTAITRDRVLGPVARAILVLGSAVALSPAGAGVLSYLPASRFSLLLVFQDACFTVLAGAAMGRQTAGQLLAVITMLHWFRFKGVPEDGATAAIPVLLRVCAMTLVVAGTRGFSKERNRSVGVAARLAPVVMFVVLVV